MPLQIRRGTEQERQALSTPLANGEPLWVSDTHQLYVGDGTTAANLLASITSYSAGGSLTISDIKGSVYSANNTLLVDGVNSKLLGTHVGTLNGSVYTTDGLTKIIDGTTGYVSTDTVTSSHNFSTALQLGTAATPTGTGTIYNAANQPLTVYTSTANTNPKISINSSNGTITSPTATTTGNELGGVSFNGFVSGSNYSASVVISALADSGVVNNKVPGRFEVVTTAANGVGVKTLSFDSSGNLTAPTFTGNLIGNASTATIGLSTQVFADAADRDASISPGNSVIGMLAMIQDDGFGNSVTQHYTASGWETFSGVNFSNSSELKNLISDATGTGYAVFSDSPSLVTPELGSATATKINKITLTTPVNAATLTLANNSTFATVGAFTTLLTATAPTTLTLPTAGTLLSTELLTWNLGGDLTVTGGNISTNGGLTIKPPTSSTPTVNGTMTFEATSNTSVTIRLKGTDGIVRSAVLTLAP